MSYLRWSRLLQLLNEAPNYQATMLQYMCYSTDNRHFSAWKRRHVSWPVSIGISLVVFFNEKRLRFKDFRLFHSNHRFSCDSIILGSRKIKSSLYKLHFRILPSAAIRQLRATRGRNPFLLRVDPSEPGQLLISHLTGSGFQDTIVSGFPGFLQSGSCSKFYKTLDELLQVLLNCFPVSTSIHTSCIATTIYLSCDVLVISKKVM